MVLGVVESWEMIDNKIFIFYICKDVKWFNGDFVIVYDFVYSF